MDAVDNFYTDQSFVDWYKTAKDIHFSKRIGFWTWWLSNWEYCFTQISCAKVK